MLPDDTNLNTGREYPTVKQHFLKKAEEQSETALSIETELGGTASDARTRSNKVYPCKDTEKNKGNTEKDKGMVQLKLQC